MIFYNILILFHDYLMKKISLVIPIFNEYNNLNNLIEEISFHLKNYSYEIILVNDASTDKSKILLEELKEKYHTIILINNKKTLGKVYLL